MTKLHKNKKGFTLVELLVVIAIIAVLSSIGVVSFRGARRKANDGKAQADLRTIQSAVELYSAEFGMYPGEGGVTLTTFDSLLTAINVSQGLKPPSGYTYCYREDTAATTYPIYVLAASGMNDDDDQGYSTDVAPAEYEIFLGIDSTGAAETTICGTAAIATTLNCDDTAIETLCLGN